MSACLFAHAHVSLSVYLYRCVSACVRLPRLCQVKEEVMSTSFAQHDALTTTVLRPSHCGAFRPFHDVWPQRHDKFWKKTLHVDDMDVWCTSCS